MSAFARCCRRNIYFFGEFIKIRDKKYDLSKNEVFTDCYFCTVNPLKGRNSKETFYPDLPLTSAPIPQKKILFLCWKINYPLLTAIHYGFLPYPHIPHSFWNLNQKYQASSTLRFQLFNKRLKFVEQ